VSIGVVASHAVAAGGGGSAYQAAVLADTPRLYLKLDETSGTTAADSSGAAHDGTYFNSPTLGSTSLLTDGSGKSMGMTANGGTIARVPNAAWMDSWTGLSVECLVNLSSAVDSTNGDALVSRYGSGGFEFLLWRNTAGKFGLQIQTGGSFRNVTSTTTPSNGTKYHLVGTWDGSNVRIYVNGALEGSPVSAPGSLAASTMQIDVGAYSASSGTTPGGLIDEVAVYDYALNSTRIAAHYAAA